ncbi:hemerythrin domain-containing protein [Ferrimonas lipolytica]|uniref:Hemerythrin n=1 Tax=Ferrimonas lipolytica TaxID=2724191 RepID=A0A6H1UG02_9GAMM|nr:hemerythrin domain-containing protein [Ferrimonas lipolytica]QIZ77530.1 hemerythrin [Ferrimonas lipolytica]
MLARIDTDHRHITSLLNLLADKIDRLEQGGAVQMTMLHDAVDYLHRYADHCHHPLEDILYQYYLDKTEQSEGDVHRLAQEHHNLADATNAILDTLRMILNDQVVPRERLIKDLQLFLTMQRDHLSYEDNVLLPKVAAALDEDDWSKLQVMVADKIQHDPLFSSSARDYEDLRAYLAE